MSSKKYTLLALVMCFACNGVFAQLAGTPDYSDSSKVRAKDMAQQNEWANGLASSPFPAKPRDAWQLGVFGGVAGIFGDINAYGWNAGISARKALGYVISVRPGISFSSIKGLGIENQFSVLNLNEDKRPFYTNQQRTTFVPSFKTELITPSLDFLVSLNNIMFHKKQSNWNYYVLVGYSPISYKTKLDAFEGTQTPYNYNGISFGDKRGEIKDQLKDLYDGEYETDALTRNRRQNFNEGGQGKRQWRHAANVGAGFERRLGDIVSLSGEVKYTLSGDDYIDGIVYTGAGTTTSGGDAVVFANLGLNFNLGLKSRKKFLQQAGKDDAPAADLGQFPGNKVAPLWMLNPLGQPYGELSNPTRMNMPKSWLEDSDSDGVTDQFDLEPNTPAGAPVDNRGRSRDTDGDGVPDYLDKELITPTNCQPVNADGVGTCPEPPCCKVLADQIAAGATSKGTCSIGSLPSVQFSGSSSRLASSSNAILDAAAEQIKANPTCKICVVGHGGSSKREQQLSWDRVNSVINYMVETKGISRDRFVFKYGEAGDANTVDLQDCTGEEGPNTVPAPHPQYRAN